MDRVFYYQPTALDLLEKKTIKLQLPALSPAQISGRFAHVAVIQDPQAFSLALDGVFEELLAQFKAKNGQVGVDLEREAITSQFEEQVSKLITDEPWAPSATDIQRGRAIMLKEFDQPRNLPIPKFALLSHKSRQQIYADIKAKKLLSLSVAGTRKTRIPDWQLDPALLQFTQRILSRAEGIDPWTLFHTLTKPMESLKGQSPIKFLKRKDVDPDFATDVVLSELGIHV
jgi:hypothetical protein